MKFIGVLAAAAAALVSTPAAAATLVTDSDGRFIGATGVIVNGVSYDVNFVDGTCDTVYGGSCASGSVFDFPTEAAARQAAGELSEQVLARLGTWSNPLGCDIGAPCSVFIAFAWEDDEGIGSPVVTGIFDGGRDDSLILPFTYMGGDTGTDSNAVYARFIGPAVSAVPEPSTWAMMLVGFGGIGFAMRRRRRDGVTAIA